MAVSRSAVAPDLAAGIYESEVKRLEGLEAKLRRQLSYVTALAPIATGVLAGAWSQRDFLALGFAGFGVAELILAFSFTLKGTSTRPTRLATGADLETSLRNPQDIAAQWAAVLLTAAEENEPLGIDLNNAIWVVRTTLLLAAIFVGIAGGLLL